MLKAHALINITEKIRSALDQNKVSCGIFIDTVNQEMMLYNLNYYGFRGVEIVLICMKENKRSVLMAMNWNLKLCIPQAEIENNQYLPFLAINRQTCLIVQEKQNMSIKQDYIVYN